MDNEYSPPPSKSFCYASALRFWFNFIIKEPQGIMKGSLLFLLCAFPVVTYGPARLAAVFYVGRRYDSYKVTLGEAAAFGFGRRAANAGGEVVAVAGNRVPVGAATADIGEYSVDVNTNTGGPSESVISNTGGSSESVTSNIGGPSESVNSNIGDSSVTPITNASAGAKGWLMGFTDILAVLLAAGSAYALLNMELSFAFRLPYAIFIILDLVYLSSGLFRYPALALEPGAKLHLLIFRGFLLSFGSPLWAFLFFCTLLLWLILCAFTGAGLLFLYPAGSALLSHCAYTEMIKHYINNG